MDISPGDSAEWIDAMHQLIRSGHAETAMRQVTTALADDPDSVALVHLLSIGHLACGRSGPAIESARRAVALAPDDFRLLVNLSNVLRQTGEAKSAVEPARAAVALEPESHGALGALARAHLDSGAWQEGKRVIERSLQVLPGCNGCRNNLAYSMYKLAEYEGAAEVTTQVLASDPNDVYALCLLGELRLREDRLGEADTHFRDALRIDPDDEDARRGLDLTQRRAASWGSGREQPPIGGIWTWLLIALAVSLILGKLLG